MKSGYKYLLIISLTVGLALGLLLFFTNAQPNMEVVIINNSGQTISLIELKTDKTKKNIRLHEVDVGTEVTVKFNNEGEDTLSIFIRLSDGKEIQGESFHIAPGDRVIGSVTQEKITAEHDLPATPDI